MDSLAAAQRLRPNFESAQALPERRSAIDLGVEGPLSRWRSDFLFAYDIFPPNILRGKTQWGAEGRAVRVGDIILQRAFLPPLGGGFSLRFAVRISEVIDEETRRGFVYETLAGHAERGTSSFCLVLHDGHVSFRIHTFSEPAFLLARITQRIITLPYQAWCTRQALRHARNRFRAENALATDH